MLKSILAIVALSFSFQVYAQIPECSDIDIVKNKTTSVTEFYPATAFESLEFSQANAIQMVMEEVLSKKLSNRECFRLFLPNGMDFQPAPRITRYESADGSGEWIYEVRMWNKTSNYVAHILNRPTSRGLVQEFLCFSNNN